MFAVSATILVSTVRGKTEVVRRMFDDVIDQN